MGGCIAMPRVPCLLAAVLIALVAASVPAAEPAAPAAAEAPALAPDVAEVLDKMDAAGKDLRSVRSKFDYELNQTLYSDIKKRKGDLLYQAPNMLRFEFTDKPQETFVFDGRVLYHRKDPTKQLIVWELRLASEPPVESLSLGKTPFPLPFGQKKETVLKFFTPSRDAKEEAADPEKRAVLVLVPKKDSDLARDYAKVLLWVDAKTWIPTRARLFDTSENITTVDFHHIETNKDIDPKSFTKPSVPQDWEVMTHAKEK
jgi:outer membrane lipoprotein-sorting protein